MNALKPAIKNWASGCSALALVALTCATGTTVVAQSPPPAEYEFHIIDPGGQGQLYVDAHGINNSRQVVVSWSPDWIACYAAIWQQNARTHEDSWVSLDYTDPNCPDAATYLTSLNDRGVAFGAYWSVACDCQFAAAVNVKRGTWSCLPAIKDFPYNQGTSMNNSGRAVGAAVNDDSIVKHWIWDGKRYVFPNFPANWDVSEFWAGPLFINEPGQIAGQYLDLSTGRYCGYFQDGAKVTGFEAPGHPIGTKVNGLTDSGDLLLVGIYDDSDSPYYPYHSFTWRKGVFTSLPDVPFEGAVLTWVYGINDRGDLCGVWVDQDGLNHAFVAFKK
jgi:uncharacterized membrane protein